MPFDLEELLNRRKPSMKRPAAAAVHRRPAAVVTLDSDSDKDIEVLLDAELEDKDPQPFPQLHLAWNIGCWFKWWMLCFFLNVSAIDFLSLVCFLHIIVYWGRPFRFPAISTGLGPWLSDGGGLVLLYLCIFVSSLTIITVEAMARNFVASQRRALWDGICQRQIMCSVWVRESFKCLGWQKISKLYVGFMLSSGKCSWKGFDLFGGALCLRQAWQMIGSAAHRIWGVTVGGDFGFNVAQPWLCVSLLLLRKYIASVSNRWEYAKNTFVIAQVELNKACIKLHDQLTSDDSCCFPDIMTMVDSSGKGKDKWCPSKLRVKQTAFCKRHKKPCLGLIQVQP